LTPAPELPTIVIVSDKTGATCARVIDAALWQFDSPKIRMLWRTNVATLLEAESAAESVARQKGIIFYTLASAELKAALRQAAERYFVPAVDLLEVALSTLADFLARAPSSSPNLLRELEGKKVERITAIDFTLEHDDGQRLRDIAHADVVLVGVSRVSKSTMCLLLAYRGIRAANVPLLLGQEPPPELLKFDSRKIIGLTACATFIKALREARVRGMHMLPLDNYVDASEIAKELRYASEVMAKHAWRSIDITAKPTEDVAREIVSLLGSKLGLTT
jgi:regulator of PEP synthase PpsR (kinase-PPPase family)